MPLHKINSFKALVASSALLFSSLALANDWQLDMDENGVQLFTKESQSSPLKQVKVVTSVKGSLSGLVSFLSDHSAFPEWMDKISKAEQLREISDQESITYTVVDAPWPERDRDTILYSRWEQNPETLVVTKKVFAEPQYLNKDDSMIRIPHMEAEWVLTPKGSGMVEVAYVSDYDPGGDVQGWLLDMFTYEIPFNTMKNLRASALGKYEGAKFAFIKEPVSSGVAMTQ